MLSVLALSRFAEEPFTQDDVDFLGQIARQVAIAIENALGYKEIAELKEKLAQEKLYLEDEIRGEMDFEGIVGQSSPCGMSCKWSKQWRVAIRPFCC